VSSRVNAPNFIRSAPRSCTKQEHNGRTVIARSKQMRRQPRDPRVAARRIIVVAVPPVAELDLVGPIQVFSSVNRLAGKRLYRVEVITVGKELGIPGEGGLLDFHARGHLRDLKGEFDSTLLVCGLASRHARDPQLFTWLRQTAPKVRRVGAVCVGAFLLAAAGLL
jgi:transcriptional regulator GlxA family with amidase domain